MRSRILTPASAMVLRNVCILTSIFFGIQICCCDVTSSTYHKQENTRFTAVYNQIQTATDIACCSECHFDSSCNSVSYNPETKECKLSSTISLPETDSATKDNGEWVKFSLPQSSCKNYLVGGPNGVEDSQLTESDYWCKYRKCKPPDGHSAKYARLHTRGRKANGWWSSSNNTDEYVQIFKGNDGRWRNDLVIRNILGTVRARCVRIIPVTWDTYRTMRFDVLGC